MTRPRSEHVEQAILVARMRAFYSDVLVFAVPNGGARSKTEAAKLKNEGVKAGVPDLVIAEPRGRYHGLYVEVKRVGGKSSKEQVKVMAWLRRKSYAVLVADGGVDAAFADVERYLRLGPHRCKLAPARVYSDDSTDLLE